LLTDPARFVVMPGRLRGCRAVAAGLRILLPSAPAASERVAMADLFATLMTECWGTSASRHQTAISGAIDHAVGCCIPHLYGIHLNL
jgi:hypothetical protein